MEAETRKPGFYGWWLLFFLWIVYTIPIGFVFYGPPVLYPFMIEETGWSRGDIMVGYAAIMLLTGVASPLAAWMIGRLGVRVTIFIGGIGVAATNFAMALIGDSYVAYLALCVLLGLVVAPATFIPIQTVIVFWFDARRALALGLVLGGGAIGGFFAPQIVNAAVLGAGGDWRRPFSQCATDLRTWASTRTVCPRTGPRRRAE
jgi:MFS family permease